MGRNWKVNCPYMSCRCWRGIEDSCMKINKPDCKLTKGGDFDEKKKKERIV
uniref:Uncharacterized protein n=1 Tax=viral metagenome TaxID=1070528 RepID=A0A6M3JTG2_9ZZZZ